MLLKLPLPEDRNRRPDVAFVPFSRWPKDCDVPDANAWEVLPDLMVEVVSPHDYFEDVRDKVDEYLRSGVRLVWVVLPNKQIVEVYESYKQFKVLDRNDELDGGIVLPGFRLPLRELFLKKA
jgi:Uma2 family endonuclease